MNARESAYARGFVTGAILAALLLGFAFVMIDVLVRG